MPGINYSQPILGAGASAQTDFAAARARTGLNFQGAAHFKRGVKAELGLEAFADALAARLGLAREGPAGPPLLADRVNLGLYRSEVSASFRGGSRAFGTVL